MIEVEREGRDMGTMLTLYTNSRKLGSEDVMHSTLGI